MIGHVLDYFPLLYQKPGEPLNRARKAFRLTRPPGTPLAYKNVEIETTFRFFTRLLGGQTSIYYIVQTL